MDDFSLDFDAINWSDLRHAYGPADDVPGLLRELLSEVPDARQEALYRLMENVWHQGTIYEASSHVIPFLVSMLHSPSTPDRSMVALLFASIADGSSYLETHTPSDAENQGIWDRYLSKQGRSFAEQATLEHKWVQAVRDAVDPHVTLLYEFIDHEEPELRFSVASALGKYPNYASSSLEILNHAISIESEEYVRIALEESVTLLRAAI